MALDVDREHRVGEPMSDQQWWRKGTNTGMVSASQGASRGTGRTVVLDFLIVGEACEGLLDTGASRSFIRQDTVDRLKLKVENLNEPYVFTTANSGRLHINRIVPRLTIMCGGDCITGDFLVGPVPHDLLFGLDWLENNTTTWEFRAHRLWMLRDGKWKELPVRYKGEASRSEATTPSRNSTDSAYEILARQVVNMLPEEAAALLRPPNKRYKPKRSANKRVRIKDIVEEAKRRTDNLSHAIEGLNYITILPSSEQHQKIRSLEERQGSLLCAIWECRKETPRDREGRPEIVPGSETGDPEESPWPTAKLDFSEFDTWMSSQEARKLPTQILEVLQQHRRLFPNSLPDGLPPKRPYDHRILLLPGKLPTKAPIYKMPPDQLVYHNEEISRLCAKGWIGPTYSPICAPTIMVDKRDDGTGKRKMRMVVNYQALNALTIAPDFPMPTVQMILEMLGGARYFSTLDLEAGFHQIRMAREDRWKTAFRSVQGLFEYRVMPFGLKGAPATFQANINAYLQPLLGHGVVAYLDDVLVYSSTLESHVSLLQQVLGIFLQHQFYPKFPKCRFAQKELTYLGYIIGEQEVKPSAEKVEAVRLWPEVMTNDTQVRQFLGTVNYCRMFMGPRFADVARPLVELTKKGKQFIWEETHTEAVRRLKSLLVDHTILRIPDTAKQFDLYTDASGYAIGAVLEQEGCPVGFLSQTMTAAQQRYSIYDQELLALVTALDKWRHLLRAATVRAYTDHQALTYLQQINTNKPLRGRTARWLDFLAEFPHLTITYLQGTRNQVADALSRHPQHQAPVRSQEGTTGDVYIPSLQLAVPSCAPANEPTSRYSTRNKKRDYRAIAGLRSRDSGPPPSPQPSTDTPQPTRSPVEAVDSRKSTTQAVNGSSVGDLQETATTSPPSSSTLPSAESDTPAPASSQHAPPGPPKTDERPAQPTCTQRTDQSDNKDNLLSPSRWELAYPRCSLFSSAFEAARQHPGEEIPHDLQGKRYTFRFDSPYLHINIQGLWRICVPSLPEFLSHVLYRHHDHLTAGHRGQKKTFLALSRLYYWPGMRAYTNAYVESCVQCRASKTISQKPAGLLQPLLIPSRRWSHVSLDFITDLPLTPRGHDCILVLVDTLSKMAHFVPTKKTATTLDTVELLADRLIRYHGFPDVLISDRDPRFQSALWSQLCLRFNIKRAMSSAYHPQTDGQTERTNRTLEQMLRTYIQTDEREWERLLPALELAYNTTSHSSTELSSFEVMIGENPLTAADLDVVGALAPTVTPPMTKIFRQLCDRAQTHIMKAKWQQKKYADSHRRDVSYSPGDLVWISSRNLPGLNQCPKFEPRFRGPFPIEAKIGQVAYRVALPPTYTCHNVFHVSQLVPDRPRDLSMTSKEAAVGWLPVSDAAGRPTDVYEVDYIMGQRGTGSSAQYLVKWRGSPEDRATWEPVDNLQNCPALLRAWRRHQRRVQRATHSVGPNSKTRTALGNSPPGSQPGGEKERPKDRSVNSASCAVVSEVANTSEAAKVSDMGASTTSDEKMEVTGEHQGDPKGK